MNVYLNLVNTNLALELRNLILGFFGYTKFLDLADLDIFINHVLFILITSILSTLLLSSQTPSMTLTSPIDTNFMILLLLIATN